MSLSHRLTAVFSAAHAQTPKQHYGTHETVDELSQQSPACLRGFGFKLTANMSIQAVCVQGRRKQLADVKLEFRRS